jgi:hypothetical protein
MASGRASELPEGVRRAEGELSDRPRRQEEARQIITLLEHLIRHGPVKGNVNLSETAITRRAQGFLWAYDDDGFRRDDGGDDDD